ncbi:uncharacterized protein NPIL_59011 [Nephila pilipes]|uniref:Uncharacterized protein n=1 Tax=Nephila pilipes TaxID=299642 RepID=A0A8X6QMQ9_NEPPI|nr:uncharacterized protein NPIL_59011 [Nephila pilipes]
MFPRVSNAREITASSEERGGKLVSCLLLGITFFIIASNKLLTTITLPTLEIVTDFNLERRRIMFLNACYIGHIFGCIFAGLLFDFLDRPKNKQLAFTLMLIALALTAACVPLSQTTFVIGITFLINGICIKFCKIGRTDYKNENLIYLFWGCFVLGRFFSIGIACKCLTPLRMIAIDLGLLLCSGCFFALTTKEEIIVLWIATGLVGLAGSSLLPTTFAWLTTHIFVNSKVITYCYVVATISLFVSTFLKSPALSELYENPVICIVLTPIIYALILIVQIIVFNRRKDTGGWSREIREHQPQNNTRIFPVFNPWVRKSEPENETVVPRYVMDLDSIKSNVKQENRTTVNMLRDMENQSEVEIHTKHTKSLIKKIKKRSRKQMKLISILYVVKLY